MSRLVLNIAYNFILTIFFLNPHIQVQWIYSWKWLIIKNVEYHSYIAYLNKTNLNYTINICNMFETAMHYYHYYYYYYYYYYFEWR